MVKYKDFRKVVESKKQVYEKLVAPGAPRLTPSLNHSHVPVVKYVAETEKVVEAPWQMLWLVGCVFIVGAKHGTTTVNRAITCAALLTAVGPGHVIACAPLVFHVTALARICPPVV